MIPKYLPKLVLYSSILLIAGQQSALTATNAVATVRQPLPRSTPESQGISSSAVLNFVEALDKIDTMNSFMVVRHGRVIAAGWWKPEQADQPHVLNSVSKSFNATAVGLAFNEGKLNLNDPLLKFFPNDAPAHPSKNLKAVTVRDLLTMTGGHDTEPKEVDGEPSVTTISGSSIQIQARHAFSLQHDWGLCSFSHRHQSDRPECAGLFGAAIV